MHPRHRCVFAWICLFTLVAARPAAAVWPPDGAVVCNAPGDQLVMDIMPDDAGGAYVVWSEYNALPALTKLLHVQRIGGDGTIAPGWPECGVTVSATAPLYAFSNVATASDGAGGIFVVWSSGPSGGEHPFVQHFTSSGELAAGWPAGGVSASSMVRASALSALPDGDGGLFLSFGVAHMYVQRITAAGSISAGWPANGLQIDYGFYSSGGIGLVSDGAGGVIVAFCAGFSGGEIDVYAQRVTAQGATAGGWPPQGVPVATGFGVQGENHGQPLSMIADGSGGAIVYYAYKPGLAFENLPHDLYAQKITGGGAVAAGWPTGGVPVCIAAGNQNMPGAPSYHLGESIVSDGSGGAIVVWSDGRAGGYDVYGSHVAADGTIAPGWPSDGLAICTGTNGQSWPGIASDGYGGAVFAWADHRNSQSSLYAQRITGSGLIATGWISNGKVISAYYPDPPRPTLVAGDQVIVAFDGQKSGVSQGFDVMAQHIAVGADSATVGGYWRFEEGTGPTVVDASGNGNTATLVGDAGFSAQVPVNRLPGAGANSYSLALDGLGDAATIPDSPTLRPASAITVECWVRPVGPIGWVVIAKQLGFGCCANSYTIEIGSGVIHWILSTDQATQATVAAPDVLPRNEWSHLAGTWDGTTMRLFVNGQQVAEGPLGGTIQYDAEPVNIGADSDNPSGEPGCCWFAGGIDEVRISGVALSPPGFLVADVPPPLPQGRGLRLDAFPNPSRTGSVIDWTMPVGGETRLTIYDAAGREVRSLVRGRMDSGDHQSLWDGTDASGSRVSNGVYFAHLWIRGQEHPVILTKKVTLAR